jgi:hypothetical protein
MRCFLVAILMVVGLSSVDKKPSIRETVKIKPLDVESLVVLSNDPIERLYMDDMYENTDYMLDEDQGGKKVTVRMLTSRGPLKFIVVTKVSWV